MKHTALVGITNQVAQMLNRSEIFRSAWASYRIARPAVWALGDETGRRRFLRNLFSRHLRNAWANARKQSRNMALTVHDVVGAVRLSDAAKAARLVEINAELQAQDYSDAPTNWTRRATLRAECAQLAAQSWQSPRAQQFRSASHQLMEIDHG